MPLDLHLAVEHAYKILDWYENLTEDEIPPKWMWHLDHELELWFEEVERRRDEKYGRSSDEAPDMMKNDDDLIRQIRGR